MTYFIRPNSFTVTLSFVVKGVFGGISSKKQINEESLFKFLDLYKEYTRQRPFFLGEEEKVYECDEDKKDIFFNYRPVRRIPDFIKYNQ